MGILILVTKVNVGIFIWQLLYMYILYIYIYKVIKRVKMTVNQVKLNNYDYYLKNAQAPAKTNEVSETIFGSNVASTDTIKPLEFDVYEAPASINTKIEELKNRLSSVKEEQGLIGKAWDGIKNFVGLGAGSNKAEKAIEQYENGEISYEEAEEAITKYEDGQNMSVDVVGDIVSGIVSVGAVAFAPFTGGASLLVGAAAGAVTKVAVKGADSLIGGRDYNLKDFGYDIITGSINGLMAPVTNAIGGVAGTGVAKACGLNVAKTATKEAAEGVATTGAKGFLTRLLANQGAEYVAKEGAEAGVKTVLAKVAAYGTDMAIDGALGGATDGFARTIAEGDFENMGKNLKEGFVGGLIASPVIGGGFKVAGKAGNKLASKVFSSGADAIADQTAKGASDGVASMADDFDYSYFTGKASQEAAEGAVDSASHQVKDINLEMAPETQGSQFGDEIGNAGTKQNPFDVEESEMALGEDFIPDYDSLDSDCGLGADVDLGSDFDIAQEHQTPKMGDELSGESNLAAPDFHEETPDILEAQKPADYVVTQQEAAISKKILELKASHQTTTKNFNIDGKNSTFTIYKGSQAGSNKGGYVVNNSTGELFYSKLGSTSQSQTEVLASKLYKAAGIDVPELTLYTDEKGSIGLLSKFIPELSPVSAPQKDLAKGFGMDALLANWDAVCSNNAVTDGSAIYRIDVGGTFDFRAQGGKKAYTSIVDEVTTLIDPKYNQVSSNLFSSMTREDLIDSLQRVADLSDDDIIKILQEQGMTKYQDVLLKRKQFMVDLLNEVKKMPDDGSDMLTLLTKAKNKTYETSISRATSIKDLADIQTSISKVADADQKKVLQQLLDAKKAEVNAATFVPISGEVDEAAFENLLMNAGVIKDSWGNYIFKISQEYQDAIVDKYGPSTGSKIINKMQTALTKTDIDKMRQFMNVADGKYAGYFANDMMELLAFYQVISQGSVLQHIDEITPGQWDAIINTTKYKVPVDTLESLVSYKATSGYINPALTSMKNDPSYIPPADIKAQIDSITQYIDSQSTSQPMKVYRGEGYEVLDSVEINGKKLSSLMMEAELSYDQQKIDNLIDMIEQGNYVAYQERFMSTSLLKKHAFKNTEIAWELDVPAGSKGVFLEGCNISGSLSNECEYLLQRGCKILIKEMEYKNGQWYIKGSIIKQ